MRVSACLVGAWLTLFVAPSAMAQENMQLQEINNHFHLSASASIEVPNDLMTATLVYEAQGDDAAMLANEINENMRWALDIVKDESDIVAETRDYETWPIYDKSDEQRIVNWNAMQTLALESADFELMTDVIQQLQERLQVNRLKMSASDETRRAAVDDVMELALDAFKQRAERVRENLNASAWRFGNIHIDTSADQHQPEYYGATNMMMSAASADIEAPALEAGNSTIAVTVSGNIIVD
ncbi:MAG: hypothetical protein CSB44_00525 [Gammaproteobacteria bacterium]|nr:MAG: hypothetical protein CSB44_00525 [Gammaproteobacteria bacterium]